MAFEKIDDNRFAEIKQVETRDEFDVNALKAKRDTYAQKRAAYVLSYPVELARIDAELAKLDALLAEAAKVGVEPTSAVVQEAQSK